MPISSGAALGFTMGKPNLADVLPPYRAQHDISSHRGGKMPDPREARLISKIAAELLVVVQDRLHLLQPGIGFPISGSLAANSPVSENQA